MEKLINILFGILNWYEGTLVRADDPVEIADMKMCERRAVGTFFLGIAFAGLSTIIPGNIPQGDKLGLALAPLFSYLDKGLTLASLAAIVACIYFVGRGLYRYFLISR